MKTVTCSGVSLLVPVDADAKIGKRWGELTKIKLD